MISVDEACKLTNKRMEKIARMGAGVTVSAELSKEVWSDTPINSFDIENVILNTLRQQEEDVSNGRHTLLYTFLQMILVGYELGRGENDR